MPEPIAAEPTGEPSSRKSVAPDPSMRHITM
jgi:hypothetical protein